MQSLEFLRSPGEVKRLAEAVHAVSRKPCAIMEICGGQTHAIMKFGLDQLLPRHIEFLHGPGCPVCVTPAGILDRAIGLSQREGVLVCTFGDMVRVPGSAADLWQAKAAGGGVRIVYSPLDAVALARQNPGLEVVFLAIGFETTAPANALAVLQAEAGGVPNFSLLVSQVLVPPAMGVLLAAPDCRIGGFLAAGHVCAITGTAEYFPLAARFRVPIVVTGFEPVDILRGVLQCVRQIEEGRADVENAYPRAVPDGGNPSAMALLERVFEVCDQEWRGLGALPASGLRLRENFAHRDAAKKFSLPEGGAEAVGECRSGEVLQGRMKPPECPAFGTRCTPDHPLGATMVSSEGACAAYARYAIARTPKS